MQTGESWCRCSPDVDAWLDQDYAPEATEARTGVSADRVRALAAELARVAFEEEIELPIEWTD